MSKLKSLFAKPNRRHTASFDAERRRQRDMQFELQTYMIRRVSL